MSRWDILLDRTNQTKIKTDYVNEVNKENEKKYWKERCDKAQDKFFDMIKAEELKEIFDLYEALGTPLYYWKHSLGHYPTENHNGKMFAQIRDGNSDLTIRKIKTWTESVLEPETVVVA